MYKIAVITPYYKEPTEVLKKAHDSVLNQGVNADHFFIADGFPNLEITSWKAKHIILSESHGDNGNTPRGIGSALADIEGYDFIAYLDADNWYHENHLQSLIQLYEETKISICTSFRTFHTLDGEDLKIRERDEDLLLHVDTSCLFIHRSSFALTTFWLKIPKQLSPMCDRVFVASCRANRYPMASTKKRTVAFRSQYESHYKAANRTSPQDIKISKEIFYPCYQYLKSATGVNECISRLGFWPMTYM